MDASRAVTNNAVQYLLTILQDEEIRYALPKISDHEQTLVQVHRRHLGVYSRVAARLHVDPSLVSRVANGTRKHERVWKALIKELSAIQKPYSVVLVGPHQDLLRGDAKQKWD